MYEKVCLHIRVCAFFFWHVMCCCCSIFAIVATTITLYAMHLLQLLAVVDPHVLVGDLLH